LQTLVIGSGRMARHLHFYFNHLSIPLMGWSRSYSEFCSDNTVKHLQNLVERADCIWVAVADRAIENVISLVDYFSGPIFHVSATHLSKKALDVHFLGSFSHQLFDPNFYQSLAIVTSQLQTKEVLRNYYPELKNKIHIISPSDKARYHSACVIGGPGAMTLWWQMNALFQQIGLPTDSMLPYLETIFQNWKNIKQAAITGPWTRNDTETIEKNYSALPDKQTKQLYTTLLNHYYYLNWEKHNEHP